MFKATDDKNNLSNKGLAIVLLSGGMDSCVTTAIANEEYNIALLHVRYSQRTQTREYKSFCDIADCYKVPKERVLITELDYLRKIGGSSLTDPDIDVDISFETNARTDIPQTYVPFRNTHLLSIAVSWAEVIGAEKIYIGAVEQDSPDYPDCRKEYYDAFNKLIEVGTKPSTNINVVTPLIGMKKSEIVKKGVELNAPLHLTWSCYKENERACGKCHSCKLRLNAFKEAGIIDMISYK